MPKKTPPKKPNSRQPDPKPDEDEDEDTEGDEDSDDESPEDVNRKLNATITNRINRAIKPFQKAISDLTSQVALLAKKPEPGEEDDEETEEETPSASKKSKGQKSKALNALEKRVKDAEDRAAAAELAQKQQEEKSKRAEENAVIGAALAKAGITDPRVIRAVTISLREDELIVRDEDTGKMRFKTVDKFGTEDFVDPDAGLTKWLKTDGKSFLPAVAASGSGGGGTDAQRSSMGTSLTKKDIGKLSPVERARLELERASTGQPPLDA